MPGVESTLLRKTAFVYGERVGTKARIIAERKVAKKVLMAMRDNRMCWSKDSLSKTGRVYKRVWYPVQFYRDGGGI